MINLLTPFHQAANRTSDAGRVSEVDSVAASFGDTQNLSIDPETDASCLRN